MSRRWGVEDAYRDAFGKRREIAPEVLRRLRAAMGEPAAGAAASADPVAVVRPGGRLPRAGEVVLEDGTALGRLSALPEDVPFGYHALRLDGRELRLITGPGACRLPRRARSWGWAVQLYAARSAESWGIGDLADLRALATWSAGLGAGLLVVNPLSAAAPVVPMQRSPYFPSSRRFRNPIYLRVEAVPGATALGSDLARLAAEGRALSGGPHVDRDAAFALKLAALERIWAARPPADGLAAYRQEMGEPLRQWATYAVLAERHGPSWAGWPDELRRPGPAATRYVAEHAHRVAFHEWLQWCIDEQLAAANAELPLVQDMPVGVDRHGADAWAWQDVLALDATIGAPPDIFNQAGQEWGLPPFVPDRLRAAGYEPFIQTLRATLRHAGGARIDHALGLFRLWCMPLGDDPRDGAYVRYPTDELLEILAIESHRAAAPIVGEDLGTVEPRVRRELARRQVLSYKLVYFERGAPAGYDATSLAAVTTHDLPTIAGTWLGADLDVQRRAGIAPDHSGLKVLRGRLARAAGVAADAGLDEVILRVHAALAASPSMIVTAALEDALRVPERPNLPGTIDEHPNWMIPLPLRIEALRDDPFVNRLAAALRRD